MKKEERPLTKLVPIVRGKRTAQPVITGWLRVWWSPALGRYVSIPGAE